MSNPKQKPKLSKVASSKMADGTKWWELKAKPKR